MLAHHTLACGLPFVFFILYVTGAFISADLILFSVHLCTSIGTSWSLPQTSTLVFRKEHHLVMVKEISIFKYFYEDGACVFVTKYTRWEWEATIVPSRSQRQREKGHRRPTSSAAPPTSEDPMPHFLVATVFRTKPKQVVVVGPKFSPHGPQPKNQRKQGAYLSRGQPCCHKPIARLQVAKNHLTPSRALGLGLADPLKCVWMSPQSVGNRVVRDNNISD